MRDTNHYLKSRQSVREYKNVIQESAVQWFQDETLSDRLLYLNKMFFNLSTCKLADLKTVFCDNSSQTIIVMQNTAKLKYT